MKTKKNKQKHDNTFYAENIATEIKEVFNQTSRLLIRFLHQFKIFPSLTQTELTYAKQKLLEKNKNSHDFPLAQKEKITALEQQYSQEDIKSLLHEFYQGVTTLEMYSLTSLKTYNKQLEKTKDNFLYDLVTKKGVSILSDKCLYYGVNIPIDKLQIQKIIENPESETNDNRYIMHYQDVMYSFFKQGKRSAYEIMILNKIINNILKENSKNTIKTSFSKEIAQNDCIGECFVYPDGELLTSCQKNPSLPILFEIFGTHTHSAKVVPILLRENVMNSRHTVCLSPETYFEFEKARINDNKILVITLKAGAIAETL